MSKLVQIVQTGKNRGRTAHIPVYLIAAVLVAMSLACSLPGLVARPTPTATLAAALPPTPVPPTPTPQPLPPALVEVDPPSGAELPLSRAITFYFNQPMARDSVEGALRVSPEVAGALTWVDDTTLTFQPAEPLAPDSALTFELDSAAQSQNGLTLQAPLQLAYQTAGYLELEQSIPAPEASQVDPTSAIVAAFNRPVISLGAEQETTPPAFLIEPSVQGRGEWINTSTYIHYPDPPLEGGRSFTVRLNPGLRSTDGSPLKTIEAWTFSTALPRLLEIQSQTVGAGIRLDSPFTLRFNQPMDPSSVEAAFSLLDATGQPVVGDFVWSEDFAQVTFTPASLLQRGTSYQLALGGEVQARGGTPLGEAINQRWLTIPDLAVLSSNPPPGGTKPTYSGVILNFSGPIEAANPEEFVTLAPAVPDLDSWWNEEENALHLFGYFEPDTEYRLTVAGDLRDPWGGSLGEDYELSFRTASLDPGLIVGTGTDVLFITPNDSSLSVAATNLFNLPLSFGSVPLEEFMAMISGQDAFERRRAYRPADQVDWSQALDVPLNHTQSVNVFLSPQRARLDPGLYHLRLNLPQERFYTGPYLVVVSKVQLTYKLSATDALVWAVDLETNQAVAGAPVVLYNAEGMVMASGQTDANGIFRDTVPALRNPYDTSYAVLGQPGRQDFGMALSTWDLGTASWDFGLTADYRGPGLKAYLYTDRPIYRPGQTVYFRAVVRQAYNGRYQLPDIGSLPLKMYKNYGEEIGSFDLPISAFGTAHGEFTLPASAPPGNYRLAHPDFETNITLDFVVAEYRKPEIDLQVTFASEAAQAGEPLQAQVSARYFFDAPAGNLPVQWSLFSAPDYFSLPGYQVGSQDAPWLAYFWGGGWGVGLGQLVEQGEGLTDAQGLFSLAVTPEAVGSPQRYTLEVTIQDESGLPVSGRASARVNPAPFYIGVRPDAWVGRAEQAAGFDIQVVDWLAKPAAAEDLRAAFQKVSWERQNPRPEDPFSIPTLVPQYTLIGSTDFKTNSGGQARLAFTPPEPGTYQLMVIGGGAQTDLLLWVGGAGQAVWPELPYQRLRLTADRDSYQPGDSAQIFVPNPFPQATPALVTVERGTILRHMLETIAPGGESISLPLSLEDAPNIYVSVQLLGQRDDGKPDYRMGYLELTVNPQAFTLNVQLSTPLERLGPGDEAVFDVLVSDQSGQPLQGEFSLAVVDRAVLALTEPNVIDIDRFFYGSQPLGVRTGLALAAYAHRQATAPAGGGGGGGDGFQIVVRERFPDTAYWSADIVTDANGRARVSLQLPDTLTTWQVLARGVTQDSLVGQAEIDLITTKELLVRPVTPRFLVAGDHVELAALVHNNTGGELLVNVSLQPSGFQLDDAAGAVQRVQVGPGSARRVTWWGTVLEVPTVDLVFTAQADGYQDAARPALGKLPVKHYTTPQVFRTSGVLEGSGERLELISLPRSFSPEGGELYLELSPSLGSVMLNALDVLENFPYACTEQTLSRFLPNLETYRAMQSFGVNAPALQARLERTLNEGLAGLLASQNQDGGWSWWQGGESDPYVSAYVLFGLIRTQAAGIPVSESAIQRGVDYLLAALTTPQMGQETWQLDRLAFEIFALEQAGAVPLSSAEALYEAREQLSPWGQALLAIALRDLDPGSEHAKTLISDLEAGAIRSATGAHWEERQPGWQNMTTPTTTSAIVLYALAQVDPGSPLVTDAVRYLVAHRQADGGWSTTYTSAWSILALTQVLRGTGELGGEFTFQASLNGIPLAEGQGAGEINPVTAHLPLANLYPDYPNALQIQRQDGSGRLFYTAGLSVYQPVEAVPAQSRGMSVTRSYELLGGCTGADCQVNAAPVGDMLKVRVTLTLPNAAYYLLVEDYLPAGAEILNRQLLTSQQPVFEEPQPEALFDPRQPYAEGWGWWLFSEPQVYDDHIAWAADYLPAGTYELTYILVPHQVGEYQVLPARAWRFYFPEVSGSTGGQKFTITP